MKFKKGDKIVVVKLPSHYLIPDSPYNDIINKRLVGKIVKVDNDNVPYSVEFPDLGRDMYFFKDGEIVLSSKLDKILS